MWKVSKVLYQALIDDGVAANLHYIPVHRHPYYEKIGFKSGEFPVFQKRGLTKNHI